MKTISCVLFLCCLGGIACAKIDCSLDYVDTSQSCNVRGDYSRTIYCAAPYKCCPNGCCFDGNRSGLFSDGELVGLILNGTALLAVGILSLVICGATYCNDKEDESHLFMKKRAK